MNKYIMGEPALQWQSTSEEIYTPSGTQPPTSEPRSQYRYVGQDRSTDQSSTKQFRRRLRSQVLEVISSEDGYAVCRDVLTGEIHQWVKLSDLRSEREGGAA